MALNNSAGTTVGNSGRAVVIWRSTDRFDRSPVTANHEEFADDGSLSGRSYSEGTSTPVHARCE